MFEFNLETQPPYLWLNLKGKLISDGDALKMMEEVSSQINKSNNILLLNLEELNYINSSGFNNFLKLLTISRNQSGDLILLNINNNINQLLITTKLNTIFKIEKSVKNISEYINKN